MLSNYYWSIDDFIYLYATTMWELFTPTVPQDDLWNNTLGTPPGPINLDNNLDNSKPQDPNISVDVNLNTEKEGPADLSKSKDKPVAEVTVSEVSNLEEMTTKPQNEATNDEKTSLEKKEWSKNFGGDFLWNMFGKAKKSIQQLSSSQTSKESLEKKENTETTDEDLLYDSFILDSKTKTKEQSLMALRGQRTKSHFLKNYTSKFGINIVLIVIGIVLSFLTYSLLIYFQEGSKAIITKPKHQEIVQKTREQYNKYGQMLGIFDLYQYDNLSLIDNWDVKVVNLLQDKTLNPIQKKDLLQTASIDLWTKIVQNYQDAKTLRESMNKDWFFPIELVTILKEENSVDSLQRSLVSLEIVKFSSAMKVFSLMDMFVSSLANSLGFTKDTVKERIQELILRGEKDIELYLSMCYNNPYEPTSCSVINDFENYYKNFTTSSLDKGFDTNFFKQLMNFIDVELEYSDIPNFSIIFNSFNAKSSSIGFSIEVNTFKEDELALIDQGVKSPHIFVVSELIKSLKQSLYILWKAIDARDIKVNAKSVAIGSSRYVVNNSVKSFFLPIQKNTEREIFDFHSEYDSLVLGDALDLVNTETEEIDLEDYLLNNSENSLLDDLLLESEGATEWSFFEEGNATIPDDIVVSEEDNIIYNEVTIE